MKKIIVMLCFVALATAENGRGECKYKTAISTCDLCGATTSYKFEKGWSGLTGDVIFYDAFGFNSVTRYFWIMAGEDRLTMCPDCTEKVIRSMYDFPEYKKKVDWMMERRLSIKDFVGELNKQATAINITADLKTHPKVNKIIIDIVR